MSIDTHRNWVYKIQGRNIQLYQRKDGADVVQVANYNVRLPFNSYNEGIMYPDESITNGLMYEGTAYIEPFVNVDPNALDSGSQPTLTEVANPTETSHVNFNRLLSLAIVDYVKACIFEDAGDIDRKEYYMKEFYSRVSDSESNKRITSMTVAQRPYALI
tara:strand:- start:80 stop:559 length:480 start_codon:yes stop_codon:yes gene_type:complete